MKKRISRGRYVLSLKGREVFVTVFTDVDPGPWGPCVVDATNKFTQTTEVLWRKRDSMATL